MKSCCLIPARGGSVRVPRKALKLFHGKPVIQYSIDTALESGLFDEVIVSTDDDEIDLTARCLGARVYRRPSDDGTRGTQEVAKEFLDSHLGQIFGLCCVIYPAAPLLVWWDLVEGWQALHQIGVPYAMSVSEVGGEDIGGFYWGFAQAFRARVPLVGDDTYEVLIPPERCCDINTINDFERASRMYGELHGN